MAGPFESFAGKASRPRARFKGRSPAAVALRCGAMLALLALNHNMMPMERLMQMQR